MVIMPLSVRIAAAGPEAFGLSGALGPPGGPPGGCDGALRLGLSLGVCGILGSGAWRSATPGDTVEKELCGGHIVRTEPR